MVYKRKVTNDRKYKRVGRAVGCGGGCGGG